LGSNGASGWGDMINQSWKTAVEIEEAGSRVFVRVIENGVVAIRSFNMHSEALAFAQAEKQRLGLS
jgi:hypothetical protein